MYMPAPLPRRLIRRSVLAGLSGALLTAFGPKDALGQVELVIATPDLTQEARTADPARIQDSYATILAEQDFLQALLGDVAQRASLAEPVYIAFGSSPEPIAAYSTDLNMVAISYGFVADLRQRLEAAQIFDWFPALEQTLLHEMGHALVDIKNLPREAENPESVADQMGFYFMEENYWGEDLFPVIAHWATRDAPGSTSIRAASADETNLHLPDRDRAIDYMCWIVGKEPTGGAADMFGEYVEGRDCPEEYKRLIDNGITRMTKEYPDRQAFDDPRAYFNYLLGEGLPLDLAADWVSDEYGNAVAADLAVFACARPAEAQCADSDFGAAWEEFDDFRLNGLTTEEAVVMMLEDDYDPVVAVGIGVYWCSPPAGGGCPDDDLFKRVWDDVELSYRVAMTPAQALEDTRALAGDLVADLVGASLCGEPTCWAGYDVQLTRTSETYQRGQVLFEGGPKTVGAALRAFACTTVRLGCAY